MSSLWKLQLLLMYVLLVVTSPPVECLPLPKDLAPVVFLPGNGASQLLARRLEGHGAEHCPPGETDWFQLWVDVWTFMPGDVNKLPCWTEMMELHYDAHSGRSHNTSGVQVVSPGFGDTHTVETLDDSWVTWGFGGIAYAKPLVQFLVSNGYERNISVRGAPYDFRVAPHAQGDYFHRLKELIEDTYRINGNRKVALITHSLGGIFANYFLRQMTQNWKDNYVHALTTVSTPYGGTSLIHLVFASGFSFHIPGVDTHIVRQSQRTWETSALLFATPDVWDADTAIIRTPSKTYTAHNIEEFLQDINLATTNNVWKQFQKSDYSWHHPGVPFWCMYSRGVDTRQTFVYEDDDIASKTEPDAIEYGDGDGMVNFRSLQACSRMHSSRNPVHSWTADDVEHTQMLGDEELHKQVLRVLNQPEVQEKSNWWFW